MIGRFMLQAPRFRHAGLLPFRMAAALAIALTAGCASEGGDVHPMPAQAPASAAVQAGLDGVYEGTRTPETGGAGCGFQEAVGYEVSGDRISLRTHKTRRMLSGSVQSDGRFSMMNEAGDHEISGSIVGDRLTGTETTHPHRRAGAGMAPIVDACLAQIDARRVPKQTGQGAD